MKVEHSIFSRRLTGGLTLSENINEILNSGSLGNPVAESSLAQPPGRAEESTTPTANNRMH